MRFKGRLSSNDFSLALNSLKPKYANSTLVNWLQKVEVKLASKSGEQANLAEAQSHSSPWYMGYNWVSFKIRQERDIKTLHGQSR